MQGKNIVKNKKILFPGIFIVIFLLGTIMIILTLISKEKDHNKLLEQQEYLEQIKEDIPKENTDINQPIEEIVMLPEYEALYRKNSDIIGWLKIEDTLIDYPVMQTPEDENYYLYRGFDKTDNQNGSLIMDTDSVVGMGILENQYSGGIAPSTNLIIHGHTMKSGQMFGNLMLYEKEEYGKEHNIIKFDSLYEHREYELISVFYSQVFYKSDQVFKFYKFFEADTQEEFDDWYTNIKEMSCYDTGVTATFGDEFITLSCCSYHVEDGRFVVVGKRIK